MWLKGEYRREQVGAVVITWDADIGKRAAFASCLERASQRAGASSNAPGAPTDQPGTGATPALLDADGFAIASFVSQGPNADHDAATARTQDAGSFTPAEIGQTAGTAGGGALANIKITETFLQLTAVDATRAQLQGATSRDWASSLLVLSERADFHRQGITPSDIMDVEEVVAALGADAENIYFGYNEDTGLWEVYETTTPGTLVATRSKDGIWT
jgi:hypothetical protein